MKSKICYTVFSPIPSKAAHSLHYVKQCQGMFDAGYEVNFIFPENAENKDLSSRQIFDYYNVKGGFNLTKIKKASTLSKFRYILKAVSIAKKQKAITFTRDSNIASLSTIRGIKTVLEQHVPINSGTIKSKNIWSLLSKGLFERASLHKVVVISDALAQNLIQAGINRSKLITAHDASDFPTDDSKIQFPDTEKYQGEVGYVGHLYNGKGMEVVVKLAAELPGVRFHVVGGLDADINRWKAEVEKLNVQNIVFHGFVQQKQVSGYINSFDICLLPNQRVVNVFGSSSVNISDYTSPLKMFDYMAHAKAIVASDLKVLKEVLNSSNAILCDPEHINEWKDAVEKLISNKDIREQIGLKAFEDFKMKYSWKQRAINLMAEIDA